MNAILKLAGFIGKKLFTQEKPVSQRVSDGGRFVVKQELKGQQSRRAFLEVWQNL